MSEWAKSSTSPIAVVCRVVCQTRGVVFEMILETFPNQFPSRDYEIEITCPEFTAVCPKTGQPDFATIIITYSPAESVIELKSLKLYLFSYRDRGIFYEHSINTILDDLVNVSRPRRMTVVGRFTPRGGISSKITATYTAESPA